MPLATKLQLESWAYDMYMKKKGIIKTDEHKTFPSIWHLSPLESTRIIFRAYFSMINTKHSKIPILIAGHDFSNIKIIDFFYVLSLYTNIF